MNLRDRKWRETEPDADRWVRLTEGWRELRSALSAILALDVRTVTFTGPAASLSFTVDNDTRPRGVMLVGLYRTDTGATSAITFSWTYSNGRVTTTSFSGLAATQWHATFIVIGGGA